jgi:protocatechuate 3,4-dioxygenase, alpha subunit
MPIHQVPPLKETPSQTAGPYVHIGMTPSLEGITGPGIRDLGSGPVPGSGPRITITGRIFDGSGALVTDAVVELWQADADGQHSAAWGRVACDSSTGAFRFDTVKPGRVAGPDGEPMAPHVSLWIVARGVNVGLQSRVYFDDEADANGKDHVLGRIMDQRRRQTLIAARSIVDGRVTYALDIRLQGDDETVFFDF